MKNLVRGGQTSIHSLRMTSQLFSTITKIALAVVIMGDLYYVAALYDFQSFKEVLIFLIAEAFVFIGAGNFNMHFTGRHGNIHNIKALEIVNNPQLISLKNNIVSSFFNGLLVATLLAVVAVVVMLSAFNLRGKKLAAEKFVRGGKIVSRRKLAKIINKFNFKEALKSRNPSNILNIPYCLAKIPFPRNAEFLHTVILGSTGTGKTNAILELLDQIRRNGDRAIIYDKMGTYTATYYDSKKDVILNPLDDRSKSWSFFKEIRTDSDYDYIASAFIPEKKDSSGPFWTDSARRVFATFAKKLREEKGGDVGNQEFVDSLLKTNYKMLAQFLSGTEASSLISAESEKTSLSILAILAAYISSMKYLHDDKENFSIRKWVEQKDDNGFLFISSRSDQHESLQPLISTWIDIAVKALLSVEQNSYANSNPRRIWIILDEIGSLQQLPSLLDGLAQSRQFGGAFILSLHSISQLKSIYGKDKTDTITSLCRNKLFFAGADDETSDYCSQNLGYQEIEEVKEGISYGANEIRDGVSLNTQKSLKRLVISSEIMYMKALQAYIKFAGEFPISKVLFKVKEREKIAQRFIEKVNVIETENIVDIKTDDVVSPNDKQAESSEEQEQLPLLDYIAKQEASSETSSYKEESNPEKNEFEEEQDEDDDSESDADDEENQDDNNTANEKVDRHSSLFL
jgi:type IV conjugative transfer system coupling protein TraD